MGIQNQTVSKSTMRLCISQATPYSSKAWISIQLLDNETSVIAGLYRRCLHRIRSQAVARIPTVLCRQSNSNGKTRWFDFGFRPWTNNVSKL